MRKQKWSEKNLLILNKAVNGNVEAQCELGVLYLEGVEVPENIRLGIDWLKKSVDKGFEDAQYHLGTCYEQGIGVKQSRKMALELYTASARAANKKAQFSLGQYFVAQNQYDVAVEWFKKSAKQDYAPAQYELGRCLYLGLASMKDQELGIEMIEIAAKKHHAAAERFLEQRG